MKAPVVALMRGGGGFVLSASCNFPAAGYIFDVNTPRRKELLAATVLGLLSFALHAPFFRAAPGLMNADYALFPLLSDYFRKGHWTPFTFDYRAGGSLLAAFRALWQSTWYLFVPQTALSHLQSATAFTYGFLPAILTIFVFFMCRRYVGFASAVLAAGFVAVDFQFSLLQLYSTDYYLGYMLPGLALLAIRSKYLNPFRQMPRVQLISCALITGLGVYLCRMCLIYAVAFWVPWDEVWTVGKRVLSPGPGILRVVAKIFWFFIGLGLYLEIFGPELGHFMGRRVYLDAGPNWDYAKVCLLFLLIGDYIPRARRTDIKRLGLCALGFAVGMFPEIWQDVVKDHVVPGLAGGMMSQSFQRSLWVIGVLPDRFRELVSADPTQLASVASVLLCLAGVACLAQRCVRDRHARAAAMSGLLAVFAFIRLRNYTDEAPLHYLLPILPALFLGLASLFQFVIDRCAKSVPRIRWRSIATAITVIALSVIHLSSQFSGHLSLSKRVLDSGVMDQAWEIVQRFRAAGADVVISDNYWNSNQYTYFAEFDPVFVSARGGPAPFAIKDRVKEARRAGFMSEDPRSPGLVTVMGRSWHFRSIGKIGSFYLYLSDPPYFPNS